MRKAASHVLFSKFALFFVLTILAFSVASIRPVYAWDVSQAANSYCDATTGKVAIWVRFHNAEPLNSGKSMEVIATDEQSGASVSFGVVQPKETVDKDIITPVYTNNNGVVRFDMKWANGDGGTDVRWATYSGKVCQPVSTATPTPTASPSATPVVTASPTPSATASAAPIVQTSNPTNPSSDGRSDNLGCSVKDCSGNVIPQGGVVAGVSTGPKSLPSTGSGSLGLYALLFATVIVLGLRLKTLANVMDGQK